MISTVTFLPHAHTFWHTHESGQLLRVLSGTGWVQERGKDKIVLKTGDMIWCEAGCEHWHGAAGNSMMCHLAVSHGDTIWGKEVDEGDYKA
jgi:quercetin dioxygenase-like cupin family protein